MSSGLTFRQTDRGVTPHAQNTGTSPSRISTRSPKSGVNPYYLKLSSPKCKIKFTQMKMKAYT